jgi:hypothetical protein
MSVSSAFKGAAAAASAQDLFRPIGKRRIPGYPHSSVFAFSFNHCQVGILQLETSFSFFCADQNNIFINELKLFLFLLSSREDTNPILRKALHYASVNWGGYFLGGGGAWLFHKHDLSLGLSRLLLRLIQTIPTAKVTMI